MSERHADGAPVVRAESERDLRAAAELLDRFNRAYYHPSPGPGFLAQRLAELGGDDFAAFLARADGALPAGIGVVRVRPSLWEAAGEAYIAELYVVPDHRRRGLGAALIEAMLGFARDRACHWIELGTDEGDRDAHRLYERFGFTNLVDPGAPETGRERMLLYEREL